MQHREMGRLDAQLTDAQARFEDTAKIFRIRFEGGRREPLHLALNFAQGRVEAFRLPLDVPVDVLATSALLAHAGDAVANEPHPHAGLQQDEPGSDSIDVFGRRIREHVLGRNEDVPHLYREPRGRAHPTQGAGRGRRTTGVVSDVLYLRRPFRDGRTE